MQATQEHTKGAARMFGRFFPPPEGLSLSHSGIDLSHEAVRFFSFNDRGGSSLIKAWGEFPIPELKENLEKKEEGDIVNALIKAREKLGQKEVRVIIPEGEAYVFRITLPRLSSKKEMGSAIELQLEESVPLAPADTLFEFDTIGAPSLEEVTLSVSAVSVESVTRILRLLDMAGFLAVEANTEGRCLAKALTKKDDDSPTLIVSINMKDTVFVIAKSGKVLFSSTSPVGRDTFINAISKTLKLSREDTMSLWQKKLGSQHEDDIKFFESIVTVTSTLRDEMNKIVSYWKTHGVLKEGRAELSKIIITGRDASLPGIMNYLGGSIGMPMYTGDIWQNAFSIEEYLPDITKTESLDYASLAGVVL